MKTKRTGIEKKTDIVLASPTDSPQSPQQLLSLPQDHLLAALGKLALQNAELKDAIKPSSNTKYFFEYLKVGAELWNIFSNLSLGSYTKIYCQKATPFGGIYLIFRGENLIYVGISENIRRRLKEHFNGNSNFAKELKGRYRPNDYKAFVEENLSVYFKEIDDSSFQRSLEHVIIGIFNPIFNKE